MTVGGMIGAGTTFMNMRLQRHLHDRVDGLKFKLSEQSDWRTETFSVYDTGYYTLYLSTVNAFSKPSDSDTMKQFQTLYHGIFVARIADQSDNTVWSRRIDEYSISLALPPNMAWTFLDSVSISNPLGGSWKLQTRVVQADENFSKTFSELILMPPQLLDIGWYIYGQSIKLLGMGMLILVGFCMMVLGGYLQKRASRAEL